MTSRDTPSATSSPESADGATPCASRDGLMTDLFGQAVVPASPSAIWGKEQSNKMAATYGRIGQGSSMSSSQTLSLANKLMKRLPLAGLMMSSMTWKKKRTPALRSYYQLVVSVPRNNETEFSFLPTVCKGRHGMGGSQGCKKAKQMLGRDWYYHHEAAWLMGFPKAWQLSAPTAMPSSRKSRRNSSKPQCKD